MTFCTLRTVRTICTLNMPSQRSTSASEDTVRGSAAAPLFWVCLIVAAALYAPCVLADRIVAWSELQRKYERNQVELIASQRHVQQLQRVADALESDPAFARSIARADLGATPTGTTAIDLPEELNHDPRVLPAAAAIELPVDPWYLPLMRRIASDARLRRNLLLAAAGVFLFGFLVFREKAHTPAASANGQSRPTGLLRTVFGRYIRDEV